MRSLLLLPPSILLALADPSPTALRKLHPDSSEKLFAEHLAFSPAFNLPLVVNNAAENVTARFYARAFSAHFSGGFGTGLLEKRSSCPTNMKSCTNTGNPAKCCPAGTNCVSVDDASVGRVACCPEGSECGGGVGACPADSVTCSVELGGGCCIAGYICKGVGCVKAGDGNGGSETTTVEETTTMVEETSTTTEEEAETTTARETSTTERTTTKEEESTTEERSTTSEEDTATTTQEPTDTETGGAPFRPTLTSEPEDTQTGCPTGFYGCLATHGGGCCRTDRNCDVQSCPPSSSTMLISDGVTVVVDATDVPDEGEGTCADGWSLCGDEGGPTPGCCPSGYSCGTASCFSKQSGGETGTVQKEFPDDEDDAAAITRLSSVSIMVVLAGWFLM
ncbi:uncharacterized protein F5Z01DRAFT_286995 [Emericellopsis atlantica]|uniref:GPI anchored protein n=1 Tax=Emericellopsis atlantica TaxID=2614577 RepID=A0A9P7ZFZ0_9HYPO|nr:uncharacterized protein F5Z01DRAFT_286995 [Emericellopsis atlantica]KAG9251231.1 hypothetical protein F5Z01DRAFT_286995 [Emericellopsis atlantica]